MQRIILLFIFSSRLVFTAFSQAPTFYADVAPIIYQNCTECHRTGEIGPMPFTTYEEVSEYSSFISYVTSTKYMPPWTPDPEYSALRGERYLTEAEIQLLADWHEAGAPEGDPADSPGLPDFPAGSQVGVPDLVISMPSAYAHGGDMEEQYQVYVLETGVDDETEISAVEIRPANGAIAHHALIGYTESASSISQAEALDAETPEEGYESFGDYGVPVDDFLFGGWAPGVEPTVFPSTIGKKISPNGRFLLQMHYGPTPVEESDLTSFNLFFADVPLQREVELEMMTPANLSDLFFIQPNEIKTFHGTIDIEEDISLLSVMPHCHLLGKAWEVYAVSSDYIDTIPLISIPDWDFNWQGIYDFPSLKHIPAGYTIHAICTYDNTANNPDNPNDPPQLTEWGDLTGDEMYVLFFQFVEYMEGDENITLSTADEDTRIVYQSDVLFPAWPNPLPAGKEVTVGWHLHEPTEMRLELFDVRGRLVDIWLPMQSFPRGHHQQSFALEALHSGTYFYRLTTAGGLVRSHTIQVID
tara:strand:+ start:294 stop:1877 length:1584 start_codon:yes stop_codon:yes gene_type:complete